MEDLNLKGIVAETRKIVEDYIEPVVTVLEEPGTGVLRPVILVGEDRVDYPSPAVFDDYRDTPKRRLGVANLTKIESLIDHVNRFQNAESVLFAIDNRTTPSITAVLDYHDRVNVGEGDTLAGIHEVSRPRFGQHRSRFAFPLSDEWKAWTEKDGNVFGMAEFAHFLEDRIIDVLELIPDEDSLPEDLRRFINICGGKVATPNKLVELSRGLQVHESSAVSEAINLGSGEGQISFASEHTDRNGGALNVPGLFLIGIPVFKHGPLYRIAARLRYRKTVEGLKFWYELWRTDRTFDHAFGEACERVRVETGLPLLFGTPE